MTVNLYYSTSSKSSRSARAWLVENNIPFNERDIIANPLDRDELKQILRLTENGFEDIVSTRSKAFKALHIDLSDLGFNQLLDLLVEKPQLLKRPIIYDGRGYKSVITKRTFGHFCHVRYVSLNYVKFNKNFMTMINKQLVNRI